MESRIKLARHALSEIRRGIFTLDLTMNDGDWEGYSTDVKISEPQMRYLLKKQMNNSNLFEGQELEEIDLDSIAADESEDKYCDDWVEERIANVVPDELKDLHNRIAEFAEKYLEYIGTDDDVSEEDEDEDEDDDLDFEEDDDLDFDDDEDDEDEDDLRYKVKDEGKEECKKILEALDALKDGNYTFSGELIDENDFVVRSKNVSLEIDAQLARDIVLDCMNTNLDSVDEFKEYVSESNLSEDDLTEVMHNQGTFFANSINSDWTCYELKYTLEAWEGLINQIMDGRITEDKIDKYLKYLNEEYEFEYWKSDFEDIANGIYEYSEN